MKPYDELVSDLVQAAVSLTLTERESERAVAKCKEVRATLPPGVPVPLRHQNELEAALAMERMTRAELARCESKLRGCAREVCAALEARAAAVTGLVTQ